MRAVSRFNADLDCPVTIMCREKLTAQGVF